ncbi:plasmid replication protein [Psychrobacillus sp. MER TA 171]|uniref:plasmid replication protein n=1 Tax=Psychrobacillus sp. MER TA 171 TaxID=2939577 RepID=UPI00203E452D|nr:plasmid replication protein [Psychrobacillus sp. MER TA 171]MCM3358172.1 plasmid replication protein [Psychrobacillus sp. MER TA 171]
MNNQKSSILKDENIKLSLRFGFLGLGMGGGSIAAACSETLTSVTNARYPYTALLINTNSLDLDKVEIKNPNTSKLLIGDGRGAGRNIELGEKIFTANTDKIVSSINKQFNNTDFLWIVAGLGGGTGTGSIIEAIKILMTNGFNKKFGLILTLPRKNEGQTVLANALQRLQQINNAMKGLGSIILVDNQKLYDNFSEHNPNASVSEYLQFSNRFVAETLHEMNVVTSTFKPVGENHFDSSEFLNLIKTPGVLHFARFTSKASEIDSSQSISHIGKLKEQIEDGVLSDGYNLGKTSRLAVSILANQSTANRLFNFEFANSIEEEINDLAPLSNERPIAQYVYQNKEVKDVYFYAVFAGLALPKRINELVQENNRLIELQESSFNEPEDIFAGLKQKQSNESNEDADFSSLFGKKETNKDEGKSEQEMFEALFGKKE